MSGIFKAYDIRGVYGKDLNEDIAYNIGRAFVSYLNCDKVLIGKDTRSSTPSLSKALINGIIDSGADVIDTGLSSTDMFYYSVYKNEVSSGIMVTASHNPGKYNGFKLVSKGPEPIGAGTGIEKIEDIYNTKNFINSDKKGNIIETESLLSDFVKYVHSKFNLNEIKPLKVVMDAGNGMAGLVAPEMFKNTNIEVIPLYFELDGNFPNHEANPLLEENRIDLIKKVKETKADFGVGFDGDSDRCFFVDNNGEFISGDFLTGLLAKYMLKKYGSGKIFYDVRCSRFVEDIVKENGGIPFMYKVGHALSKPKMKEENALFGGEVSGHYYFKMGDYYADNSYLPVFMVAEIISQENKNLSDILKDTKNYHISGEINSTVNNPDAIIEEIKEKYSPLGKVLDIDGLSIITEKYWLNIRKSNTEPLLRLNCEADTKENMEKLRDDLLAIIRK